MKIENNRYIKFEGKIGKIILFYKNIGFLILSLDFFTN